MASLERGLTLLEAFKDADDTLTLTELGAKTGLHKSTVLRLSASLLRRRYLQRLTDGRFRLGPAVFQLGRVFQRSFRLADTVVPILRSLVAITGESASFWIPDGDGEICLHRVESPHTVRDAGMAEGDRFRLDGSGSSRLMTAFLGAPGEEYDRIRQEVIVVARQSKRVPGGSAIVAPVFNLDQHLAGILVLSGPEFRFSDERIEPMKRAVTEHAANLTRALGGSTEPFAALLASPIAPPEGMA